MPSSFHPKLIMPSFVRRRSLSLRLVLQLICQCLVPWAEWEKYISNPELPMLHGISGAWALLLAVLHGRVTLSLSGLFYERDFFSLLRLCPSFRFCFMC